MRCFIAIDLPEEVKRELTKIQKQLESVNLKAKFVKPEQIHITLKFLGEISDNQINKIKEILKQIKFEPFKVRLNNLGVFPIQQFIRVIWVDILPKEKLMELQQKIESVLDGQGIKKDERNFETHLTLARVKFVKDKEALISRLNEIKIKPLEFEIRDFVLKKSTLTKEGPVYEDILEF